MIRDLLATENMSTVSNINLYLVVYLNILWHPAH